MKLTELKKKYDTDKSVEYLDLYESRLKHLSGQPVVLLELGVFRGESLRLWQEYFPLGTIIGLDKKIPKLPREVNPRIFLYEGLQDDLSLLDKIVADHAPTGLDIVIDDASHLGEPTRRSFWHLFERHLKAGGIYSIEDWGTGYWPSWPDGAPYAGPAHLAGMVGLAKELLDECGWGDISHPQKGSGLYRPSRFRSMQISHGQIILEKKR